MGLREFTSSRRGLGWYCSDITGNLAMSFLAHTKSDIIASVAQFPLSCARGHRHTKFQQSAHRFQQAAHREPRHSEALRIQPSGPIVLKLGGVFEKCLPPAVLKIWCSYLKKTASLSPRYCISILHYCLWGPWTIIILIRYIRAGGFYDYYYFARTTYAFQYDL